jgi:hypothetical protein
VTPRRRIDPLEWLWLVGAAALAAGAVAVGRLTLSLNPGDTDTPGAREWGYADIAAGMACAVCLAAFLLTRRRGWLLGGTILLIVPVIHVIGG